MWIDPERQDDDSWQRSMALYFLDPATGAGGVVAAGLWPNRGDGLTWVALGDGTGRRSATSEGQPDTRIDLAGLGVGQVAARCTAPGVLEVFAATAGATADLVCTDLFPPSPWPLDDAGTAALADKATGHVESAVRVTGTLTIEGRTVAVDGLGQRDQSWGARSHEGIRSYRWSVGTTGPALSWSALVLQVHDLPVLTTGFLAVDGAVEPVTSVETLVTVGHDSLTAHAWTTTVVAGDRTVDIVSDRVHHRFCDERGPLVASDTLASVRADGRPGVGALNMIVNPQLGTSRPPSFDGAPW